MRGAQSLFRLATRPNVCLRAALNTGRHFSTTRTAFGAELHKSYNVSQTVLDIDAADSPYVTTIPPPTEDPTHPSYPMRRIACAIDDQQAIGMPIDFDLCALAFSQLFLLTKSKNLYLIEADRLFREVRDKGYSMELKKSDDGQVDMYLVAGNDRSKKHLMASNAGIIYRLIWLNCSLREKAKHMEPPRKACLYDSIGSDAEFNAWRVGTGSALVEFERRFIRPSKW